MHAEDLKKAVIFFGGMGVIFLTIIIIRFASPPPPIACRVYSSFTGKEQNKVALSNVSTRLAFLGNWGDSNLTRALLDFIPHDADIIITTGDFDASTPATVLSDMFEDLDVPFLGVLGDRDRARSDYPDLVQMMTRIYVADKDICVGQIGILSSCVFNGVGIIMSNIGSDMCGASYHTQFITDQLNKTSDIAWRFCVFHAEAKSMQLDTNYTDHIDISIYELCRRAGAIVVTGDSHQYARTKIMADYANNLVANQTTITPGRSFTVVSGLAGEAGSPINETIAQDRKWAAYTQFDVGFFLVEIAGDTATFSFHNFEAHTDEVVIQHAH